jgi:GNAT superfamily N-acetyltransferase
VVAPHCRPAVSADAAECIALRGQTRENALSVAHLTSLGITVDSWGKSIEAMRVGGHVCTDHDRLIGYCFGDMLTGEILVLALLPEYEGHGMGKLLLSKVVEDLRSIGHKRLFLGASGNPCHRSYGFYRHLGWRPTGALNAHADEILELL